jgi:peptidyl-prolyl cis-trans isomerase C
MKKILLSMGVAFALASLPASADPLKNSLMPTAEKEKPAVNLDNLNVAAKPIMAKPVSRPATATVATVDGIPIKKKEADKFLALASKGQATDIDLLPKKQKNALLNGMAASVLIESKANKAVPNEMKSKIIARYWMQQAMSKVEVSDADAKAFYEKNKKAFKGKDGKQLKYDKVAQYVQMQLKQEKFNKELMKNAKVIIK